MSKRYRLVQMMSQMPQLMDRQLHAPQQNRQEVEVKVEEAVLKVLEVLPDGVAHVIK